MQNLYRNGLTSRLQPRLPFLRFRVFSHKDATIVKKNTALPSTMMNAISTLVGTELEGEHKYRGTVAAANGSLYGMPYTALRVVKFDLVDKSITHIGPAFDGVMGMGWTRGAITDSGFIYCPPDDEGRGVIKIDTNTDTVTELNRNLLPERGWGMWESCAAALNGCIYCMPLHARHIMKIDPNNDDAMTSVGDDLGDNNWKYKTTVVGIDGCVYGLPYGSNRIIKYDPINDTTSFFGDIADKAFYCTGGALGRDGCVYAIIRDGRVLKIDSTNNMHCFVGNSIESDHNQYSRGWGDAILGIDGCIYSPPMKARHILKYDPHSDQTSLVEDDSGNITSKWWGGSLASDGVIYCFPCNAERILAIDPWKEYTSSLENNMVQHPGQLGYIFHPSDDMPTDTNFDRAVTKFGYKHVLKALEACMNPAHQVCAVCNLYPFMIAASFNSSDVSVIYHLLRQVPSLANYINNCTQDE